MKKKLTLIEHLLRHKQALIVASAILVVLGIVALIEMPRDEFPQFTIRQGIIIGVFPGASSQQVEEQLTKKVENYLFQYEAVDRSKTHSISKENVMVVYVELDKKEKDPEAFWAKLRHGLNELKGDLPSGVASLTADNDFGNTSALLLAVQSKTKTYRELEDYITKFEDDIRKIPAASKIKHFGLQKEQISVYIDDAKLTNYGIKPLMVLAALKPEGSVSYAGEIDNGQTISPIHIPLRYKTESDIANQIVYSDPSGNAIRVKDVAKVVREYPEPDSYIRVNGNKCLLVSLEMRPGNNIVQFGTDVSQAINKFSNSLPPDVSIVTISNLPDSVSKAILNFLKEFGISIFAVMLVTILLLPRKVALIAASTIPISILMTLGFLWVSKVELQTVSLAGLIIVLGMVVDNAIVIIDNYVEKLDSGITPWEAASKSVTDLFVSVFTATLIIVFCFLPMIIFMTGTAGDFVASLPVTVAYSLFISLGVATTLTPLMCYLFIKKGINSDSNKGKKAAFLNAIQKFYDKLLESSFRNKKIVIGIGLISFALGLVLLLYTPQQSFPQIERNQFAVEISLPSGSSLQQTAAVIKDLEIKLKKDKRVINVASFVGTSSPRFHTLYAPNFPSKSYGQLIVITESNEATESILNEYSKKYSSYYPNAFVKWKQLDMTNFASPIEVRISGDSINTLKKTADQVSNILRNTKGVLYVRTDFEQSLQAIDLNIKQDEANRLGYSKSILAYSLLVGTKGFPVSTIWENDYPVNVSLKVDKATKTNVDDILNQYVTSPFIVSSVPVRQIADIQPEWTEGVVAHRNGVRTITVQADIERGIFAANIFNQIKPVVDNIKLSKGININYGGEDEMSVENMTPLYYALAVSVIITFLILLLQFRRAKTAIIIMATMPLSLFGAALGVFITGYPFSVTAFIGLISLMGIVVRNGIILISYAEELQRDQGLSLLDAAIAAGKRRMRPIFLTSAAAAVGVIPMIASRSTLWGPLGSVICFGVLFSMLLSLFILPVLYYIVNKYFKTENELA
jgi:multidrug efflux pump subunit AcrB